MIRLRVLNLHNDSVKSAWNYISVLVQMHWIGVY
jgi:hypothetical protein